MSKSRLGGTTFDEVEEAVVEHVLGQVLIEGVLLIHKVQERDVEAGRGPDTVAQRTENLRVQLFL